MVVRKTHTAAFEPGAGPRSFTAVLYDASEPDRDGETVDVAGVKAQASLPVQIDHSWSVLDTVGTLRDVFVSGPRLRGTITFAPEGVSETADRVFNMVKAGVTTSLSIGFTGQRARTPQAQTTWSNVELLEVSFVSIPSSRNARVDQKALSTWLRGREDMLELDDEEVLDVQGFSADELARLSGHVARRRHSEPFEPLIDVQPEEIRAAIARVVPELIRQELAPVVAAAFRRARGRID